MSEISLEEEMERLEQICAEDRYSKSNIQQEIREDVLNGLDDTSKVYKKCIKAVRKYMDKTYSYDSKNARVAWIQFLKPEDIVIELFIHVMANDDPVSIQKIVGAFGPWFKYEDELDGVKTAGEILGACRKTKLYWLIEGRNSDDGYINIESRWTLEDKTLDYIEKTRYLNPMLSKPLDWHKNIGGGYITRNNSILLGGGKKHHDYPQNLEVINTLQKIKWSLDPRILALKMKNKKPLETPEQIDNFKQMRRIAKTVYKELLDQGNMFYLVWGLDFRGRVYSSGYYVNPQGSSYHKAQLEFANKRIITGVPK